jgi:uncharacterized protein
VLDPLGVAYDRLPLSLLWNHRADDQVGNVIAVRPSRQGVEIEAVIVKVDRPGVLQQLVDRCWDAICHKVLNSLSVGLLPIETRLLASGGRHLARWLLLEVSLVSLPCNQAATITEFRSFGRYPPAVRIR